jgi:hypothetical protein
MGRSFQSLAISAQKIWFHLRFCERLHPRCRPGVSSGYGRITLCFQQKFASPSIGAKQKMAPHSETAIAILEFHVALSVTGSAPFR